MNSYFNNTIDLLPLTKARSATVEANFTAVDAGFTLVETAMDLKAPLASPTLTGVPRADTATAGTSTTQLATTAFVAATSFSTNLPGQTSNNGKYLKTDGTTAAWAALPSTVVTLTSGTTWTCPAGVNVVTVHVQGGGGGGSRSVSASVGGGGAGGYARHTFACVPATVYTIAIGAGGTAAGTDTTSGAAGSATTFNTGATTVTGAGGAGAVTAELYSLGGAGSNGDVNVRGGHGIVPGAVSVGGSCQFGSGGIRSAAASLVAATGYGSGGASNINTYGAGAGMPGCIVLEY